MDDGPLRRAVSQRLAESIMQPAVPSRDSDGGSATPAHRQDSYGQLLRANTNAELNRQQFSQTQNAMAVQFLESAFITSIIAMVVMMLIIVGTHCVGIFLFVQGWITLAKFHKLPCDQPLAGWLFAVLLFIPSSDMLGRMIEARLQTEDRHPFCASPASTRVKAAVMIARGGLIAYGFWLRGRSTTCATTNKHLHHFTGVYLVFNVVLVVVKALVMCMGRGFVLFLARHQELLGGPGEHRAARQGLINDLETVAFDPTLFSETDADKESPECCICQGEFEEGGMPLKRVPCCGHHFHEPCLGSWLGSYGRTCPLCRVDLQDAVSAAAIP